MHTAKDNMVSVTETARLSGEPVQQSQTESVMELLVPQPQSMPLDGKDLTACSSPMAGPTTQHQEE